MKEGGTGNKLHSKSVELTVLLKPLEPAISPSSPIATEDKPLNLTCSSLGGSPPPEIQWFAAGQSQPLPARYVPGQSKDDPTQSILTIIPNKDDDGNMYRCTVWNRALGENQKLEASTKIYVNCKILNFHIFYLSLCPLIFFFSFFSRFPKSDSKH